MNFSTQLCIYTILPHIMPTSKDDELLRGVAGKLDEARGYYNQTVGERLSGSWTNEFKTQIRAGAGTTTGSNTTPSKSSVPASTSAGEHRPTSLHRSPQISQTYLRIKAVKLSTQRLFLRPLPFYQIHCFHHHPRSCPTAVESCDWPSPVPAPYVSATYTSPDVA